MHHSRPAQQHTNEYYVQHVTCCTCSTYSHTCRSYNLACQTYTRVYMSAKSNKHLPSTRPFKCSEMEAACAKHVCLLGSHGNLGLSASPKFWKQCCGIFALVAAFCCFAADFLKCGRNSRPNALRLKFLPQEVPGMHLSCYAARVSLGKCRVLLFDKRGRLQRE